MACYDLLSYRTGEKPLRGNGNHLAVYDGVTYLFASEENRKMFERNPDAPTKVEAQVAFDVGDQFDDFGANFQKEMNLGARYQYNVTPRWGIEGSFLYTPVNAELARLSRDVSVDTSYYNGNVVYNILPDKQIVPFATAGIGGITCWRDAAEFMALGAANVQVCTAAMVYGFKIVQELITGLENWMDGRYQRLDDVVGLAVPNVTDWQYLNLNYVTKARIDQDLCIQCGRCHIACEDTSHQAITATVNGQRRFEVIEQECVGCNLCVEVCPIEDCITMNPLPPGTVDPRTGETVSPQFADWTTHPNNPGRASTAD